MEEVKYTEGMEKVVRCLTFLEKSLKRNDVQIMKVENALDLKRRMHTGVECKDSAPVAHTKLERMSFQILELDDMVCRANERLDKINSEVSSQSGESKEKSEDVERIRKDMEKIRG